MPGGVACSITSSCLILIEFVKLFHEISTPHFLWFFYCWVVRETNDQPIDKAGD